MLRLVENPTDPHTSNKENWSIDNYSRIVVSNLFAIDEIATLEIGIHMLR